MKKRLFTAVFIILSVFSCTRQEKADIAITNVTIIDLKGGPVKSEMTVLITHNRICKIDRADKISLAEGVTQIDGSGKFLIPGLWDMHVHWYDENYLPIFIANGVLGIRQMWGAPEHFDWRKRRKTGDLLCPRMIIPSPIIDGPKPIWPGSISVANESEAREIVRELKGSGVDFLKVYSMLPKDIYFAIADESKKPGIPFVGHIPETVSAFEASDVGQKSVEHFFGVLDACSSRENVYREQIREAISRQEPFDSVINIIRKQKKIYLDTYDEKKAQALFKTFAINNTWQCPTLVVNKSMAFIDDETFINDPRLKYMPDDIKSSWDSLKDFRLKARKSDEWLFAKKVFQKQLDIIKTMYETGVKFIAGTDVLNPYCFPGFSLHDELDLFVQAGLFPLEALQTATINAAIFNNALDSMGTVEQGKIADLVLLDANPLEDIQNTKKIQAVIFEGKLFDKADLQKMLHDIEQLAKKKSISNDQFGIAMSCSDHVQQNKNPLIGTWKFISIGGMNSNGQIFLPYGEVPYGRLMYDAKGYMCVLLMQPGRPKFKSNDMATGTCEEVRAAFMGFDAYCGTYMIDTVKGTVTHQIEGARFPNWENSEQIRNYSVRGDSLILSASVKVGGDIWELKGVLIAL